MACVASCLTLTVLFVGSGCHSLHSTQTYLPLDNVTPRELSKVVLPPYMVEPPDILLIDEVYLVPREDYQLKPRDVFRITVHRKPGDQLKEGDQVEVEVQGVLLNNASRKLLPGDALEISAGGVVPEAFVERFQVNDNWEIRLRVPEMEELLGPDGEVVGERFVGMTDHGSVDVRGKSVEEAEQAAEQLLKQRFPDANVTAMLLHERQTPIRDVFAVHRGGNGEDEIIFPPPYGRVAVTGMNAAQAEKAIADRFQTLLFQVTVRVTLVDATPIKASYWVELDGTIDLDNPVKSARAAGEGVVTVYSVEEGGFDGQRGRRRVGPEGSQPGAAQLQEAGEMTTRTSSYGRIPDVRMKTVEEAKEVVREYLLRERFQDIDVTMSIEQLAAQQQIQGEHLVCPDGTVTLGTYGSVPVVGLTLAQTKWAIEEHLKQEFQQPDVSVDVFSYNSKKYYVITQGAGLGDGVYPFPSTGNETVLDAISQINGLEMVSSKRIWISRPTPEVGEVQVLPVNWHAITAQGSTGTNYQILPGDRVFIAEDKLIAFDTNLSKLISPLERIMGFALLGVGTGTRFSGSGWTGGGNPSGGGF